MKGWRDEEHFLKNKLNLQTMKMATSFSNGAAQAEPTIFGTMFRHILRFLELR